MDQAGSGDEFLELGHKWYLGTVHDVMHHMFIGLGDLPAGKGGINSATGHLDMVPYPPDFLQDSQLSMNHTLQIPTSNI